jgi:hypothetical protein
VEERILKLPLGKGNKLKEGQGKLSREKGVTWVGCVCFLGKEKRREGMCD